MQARYAPAILLSVLCFKLCPVVAGQAACEIQGPVNLVPEKVRQVRLGMSMGALEQLLGPADYSPIQGQYYFSTGGDCPLDEDGERMASCGLVVDFRDYGNAGEPLLTGSIQSCWWGGIGE